MEDRRGRHRRILSDTEQAAIVSDIKAGLHQSSIARKYHLHTTRVHALQVEAGMAPHYRSFTEAEVLQIEAELKAGKTNVEIARQLNCSRATVWFRRKKFGGLYEQQAKAITTGEKNRAPDSRRRETVEVARLCRISTVSVRHYQRMLSLPTRQSRISFQVKREAGGGEGLHYALACVDRAFDSPLPFGPQHDVAIAAALLEALTKRYPDLYRQATETNLGELHSWLSQAIRIKRTCGATEFIH